MTATNELGIVGMAVMGRNLAMNAASKGIKTAVYNRTYARTLEAVEQAKAQNVDLAPFEEMSAFVQALCKPRRIIMMVQAGAPVDSTLSQLLELLEPSDIIVDGGNEFYANTDRRAALAASKKIHYMGMGVSGGEEGARYGPSMMPGGDRVAYDAMKPLLIKIAANVDGVSCVDYMGERSAGNYVKMVHNGIEYGDMQLIAETYEIMRSLLGMSNEQMATQFDEWNQGYLKSYLIEITGSILKTKVEGTNTNVVDVILDHASGKGTGKWTCKEACDKGCPVPTIQAALDSRYLSSMTEQRQECHRKLQGEDATMVGFTGQNITVEDLGRALYCSKISSYAQGFSLLRAASAEHDFKIPLARVAGIWIGGCIIRADFLKKITAAFERDENLSSLMVDHFFAEELKRDVAAWRKVVVFAQAHGVPVAALSASLNCYDALRRQQLPLNLVQGQRDYFGAHTFKRRDTQGTFHCNWKTGHLSQTA